MRPHQKAALFVLVLLVLIAMGWPWTAKARPLEQEYFADLTAVGITVENESGVIAFSKYLCEGMLNFSLTPNTALSIVINQSPTLSEDQGKTFVIVTERYYCPSYSGDTDSPTVLR